MGQATVRRRRIQTPFNTHFAEWRRSRYIQAIFNMKMWIKRCIRRKRNAKDAEARRVRELAEAEAMRRRREAEARAVRLSAEEAARLAALSVAEVETERLLKEAEEEADRHRLYLISLLAKETKPDTPEKPMTPQPLMQFGDAFKREKAL